MLDLDCDDALRLAGSLTCAVQFHGAVISQELSRASERDFIKVPLRKTSPPGACFRRGRTGGLLCANDSNEVTLNAGLYREENQRRLTKGPAYSLLPARW